MRRRVEVARDRDRAIVGVESEHVVAVTREERIREQGVEIRVCGREGANQQTGLGMFQHCVGETNQRGRFVDVGDGDEDAAIKLCLQGIDRVGDVDQEFELHCQLVGPGQQFVVQQRVAEDGKIAGVVDGEGVARVAGDDGIDERVAVGVDRGHNAHERAIGRILRDGEAVRQSRAGHRARNGVVTEAGVGGKAVGERIVAARAGDFDRVGASGKVGADRSPERGLRVVAGEDGFGGVAERE